MATKLSGMNRETYIIPKNSVKTIDYKDVEPNYFHIQNLGGTPLYFSSHTIPTTRIYDLKIDGGSIATFTDPYPQYEVYIFNPSATDDINIIMTSFKAPFDPVVLAQANKQISIGGTVETDGVIKGFNTALPAGANKIGKVDVASLPTIPAGSNKIGKVDVASLPTIPAGSNKIGKVDIASALPAGSAKIGRVDVDGVADIKTYTQNTNGKIDTVITLLQGIQSPEYNTSDIDSYCIKTPTDLSQGDALNGYLEPPDSKYFSKICLIRNENSTDIEIGLFKNFAYSTVFDNNFFTIKANDTLVLNMNTKTTAIAVPSGVFLATETKPTQTIIKTFTLDTNNQSISLNNIGLPHYNIKKITCSSNAPSSDPFKLSIGATVLYSGGTDYFSGNVSSNYVFSDGYKSILSYISGGDNSFTGWLDGVISGTNNFTTENGDSITVTVSIEYRVM